MGARLYSRISKLSRCPERGVDGMKMILHLSGLIVETCLVFDSPDEAMEASLHKLAQLLDAEPLSGALGLHAMPPAQIVDNETERGRQAARLFFEEWMDCAFECHELVMRLTHHVLSTWEAEGHMPRAESLRLLCEGVKAAMGFEIAAQELCDIAIESQIGLKGWTMGDCIAGLSAVAGRKLALSLNSQTCMIFKGADIPDNLDTIVYVMTKEAVRLGVPAGSDWRFGLAANDMPLNPPVELIRGLEPHCKAFFHLANIHNPFDQAVACAKAAGRMLAVASGGEWPDIEPAIAKPLAMSAMTESYKFVCMDYAIAQV